LYIFSTGVPIPLSRSEEKSILNSGNFPRSQNS